MPHAALRALECRASGGDKASLAWHMRQMHDLSWPMASPAAFDQHAWKDLASHVAQTWMPQETALLEDLQKPAVSEEISERLKAQDADIRASALAIVAQMEERSSALTSAVAGLMSEESSGSIRCRACEVLAEEAMCGSGVAASALTAGLQDGLRCVRETALGAFVCLAAHGPSRTARAAAEALRQMDAGCRYRSKELTIAVATMSA